MRFLAIDDEPLALEDLEEALRENSPDCNLSLFTAPSKALSYAREHSMDVAFIDIELGSMNGLALAKELKDIQPEIHIVFVTSHDRYAVDAFKLRATGYLLKPVTVDDIRRELTFLYGKSTESPKKVRVQTFGGFDVFVNGKPLQFRRSKAKELFAYLIDRCGVSVTNNEACAILWEDSESTESRKSYFRTIVTSLRKTLREANADKILIKRFNSLAINPAQIDCDSYRFLNGDPIVINSYRHDYLSCYSWAEFSVGKLEDI